jgi:hypothetical protein
MNKYPDFWSVLLGNGHHGLFFGYIVISLIAAAGMILVMASQKYKEKPDSPVKWSWKYFFADNAGNFAASLFILPLFIRVLIEFLSDPRIMLVVSIGIGFGFYKLAKIANNAGIWTTDALSKKIAEKIKEQENKP